MGMRIAVVGAGGVGGYFGGRLAAAGEDVRFVVRSRSLAPLRERGLRIESAVTPLALASVQATDDPAAVGPVDVALFAVKLPDAQAAAASLGPLVGPRTVVIPLQNGVESPALLASSVPAEQVAGGVAYIAAELREPGVVVHGGPFARLRFGALHESQRPALDAFEAACVKAGIDAQHVADIRRELWEKFVFLVGMSALTTVTGQPIGVVRADPDMRATLKAVMQEAVALANAEGAKLPVDFVNERMALVDTLPEGMKASMLHDLQAGRPLELPWLSGAVVRLGQRHALEARVNRAIVSALKPRAGGSPPR